MRVLTYTILQVAVSTLRKSLDARERSLAASATKAFNIDAVPPTDTAAKMETLLPGGRQ